MSKVRQIFVWVVLAILVASCGAPITIVSPTVPPTVSATLEMLPPVSIVRYPEPADFSGFNVYTQPPVYDPASEELWQVDLRSSDLTHLDLSKSTSDLLFADFDSKTQWPSSERMPGDFDWQKIMESNKDPGLGIRALHRQEITGNGVGIAIIDQTLLVDHIEYKDRIRLYEEAEDITGEVLETQMHGPAVASIAVGKSVGVAPEADLYYIATGNCGGATSFRDFDFSCRAKAIKRIVEINKGLPENRKIRVLSLSFGWDPIQPGYKEISAAVEEAKKENIFVISSSLGKTHELYFHGLGRSPLTDPNRFESYAPGLWWEKGFYAGTTLSSYPRDPSKKMLLVPMDSRTTASPTGREDYVFYREGGWSWSIPYLAGMYVLAMQVNPSITPEAFWETALNTGKTIQIQHDGKNYELGVILNPQALIEAIKSQ